MEQNRISASSASEEPELFDKNRLYQHCYILCPKTLINGEETESVASGDHDENSEYRKYEKNGCDGFNCAIYNRRQKTEKHENDGRNLKKLIGDAQDTSYECSIKRMDLEKNTSDETEDAKPNTQSLLNYLTEARRKRRARFNEFNIGDHLEHSNGHQSENQANWQTHFYSTHIPKTNCEYKFRSPRSETEALHFGFNKNKQSKHFRVNRNHYHECRVRHSLPITAIGAGETRPVPTNRTSSVLPLNQKSPGHQVDFSNKAQNEENKNEEKQNKQQDDFKQEKNKAAINLEKGSHSTTSDGNLSSDGSAESVCTTKKCEDSNGANKPLDTEEKFRPRGRDNNIDAKKFENNTSKSLIKVKYKNGYFSDTPSQNDINIVPGEYTKDVNVGPDKSDVIRSNSYTVDKKQNPSKGNVVTTSSSTVCKVSQKKLGADSIKDVKNLELRKSRSKQSNRTLQGKNYDDLYKLELSKCTVMSVIYDGIQKCEQSHYEYLPNGRSSKKNVHNENTFSSSSVSANKSVSNSNINRKERNETSCEMKLKTTPSTETLYLNPNNKDESRNVNVEDNNCIPEERMNFNSTTADRSNKKTLISKSYTGNADNSIVDTSEILSSVFREIREIHLRNIIQAVKSIQHVDGLPDKIIQKK